MAGFIKIHRQITEWEWYKNIPVNKDRYINLTLKRGKESGKLYAINNEFYQKEK